MTADFDRRSVIKGLAGAGAIAFPMLNLGRFRAFAQSTTTYSARAVELVERSLTLDLKHALSLHPEILKSWLTDPGAFGEAEWAAFKSTGLKVIQTTIETVDDTLLDYGWHNGFLATHGDYFRRVDSIADLDATSSSGQIGMILGSENSAHFRTLDDIDLYYSLGQRMSQLTYNTRNLIGSGATERSDGGLSDYGVSVVERMNKVGMAIDVSHCGVTTTLDALEAAAKPVLISHATTRALNPTHPRTKTDEAIRKMAATGGVMGIAFLRVFVRDREPTTIEHVLDHFDHVARLVGVEHVAIGSDIALYGYDALPRALVNASKANLKPGSYNFREKDDVEGLNHPKRIYDLTEGLIRRGYSDGDIALVLGGNARRVFNDNWKS